MDYDSGPGAGFAQGDNNTPPKEESGVPFAENITGLLNLTSREAPIEFTLPLLGYAMPFLLVITIIANTLVVVVLSQRHMRTPTNIVLLGMAICDMMTLLVPSPWYFYIYSLGNYDGILKPAPACYAYNSMHEVIPNFFHTASIWLTLLLAGQRYIYVCHPTTARNWCTVPNVMRVIVWIMTLALAHQLPRFFDRIYEDVQFRWEGQVLWGCNMRTAPWVEYIFAEHAYYILYYAFKVIFVNTGPCTALVLLNMLLFRALKKAQEKRLRLFQENRKSIISPMESNLTAESNLSSQIPHAEEVPMLVNLTNRGPPIEFALPLLGYAMPALLVVTIIANTFVVVVLAQRHMRTPTNIVLLGMAICDMMTLLIPSPWFFYIYTLGNYANVLGPAATCYAYNSMNEVIPNSFHTASVWLTLVLAGQRYFYVCHPTIAVTWCTVPRVLRTVCWVAFVAFAHQLPRFFDTVFVDVRFWWRGEAHWGCQMLVAEWVTQIVTAKVYFIFYYAFKVIFVNIGPCTVLVVLNILLFRALKRAQEKRMKLLKENRKSECKKLRDSNCTTMMLIVVVTVFLAVEIPLAVTIVLHVLINAFKVQFVSYYVLNITLLFTNFFLMLSYPVNFAIYCGMSKQFRKTFKDLFIMGTFINRAQGSSRYSLVNGPRTVTNETVL
ncbi:hypothetical protein HPB47_010268 [Ixodes persulcatus]|uniref:Uncharacterized protein n=1 Tax=Ixodes persulcatus TaxID=34615 RepID=A0AC60NZM6_IXOPE|nr:hypothetical protein HPB47_010268 [Ixodes persulcatus]